MRWSGKRVRSREDERICEWFVVDPFFFDFSQASIMKVPQLKVPQHDSQLSVPIVKKKWLNSTARMVSLFRMVKFTSVTFIMKE